MEPVVAWCLDADSARAEQVESMYQDYRSDFNSAAEVSPDSLVAWLSSGDVVLVDVRKSSEREVAQIPGSITRDEFEAGNFTDRRVVSYCTIGYRSGKYTEKLSKRGVDAYNLTAGILGWVHDFRPVERDGSQVRQVHVYGRQWSLLPAWYEPVW
jgi:rhodanese-related sulfurtransferase